MFVSKKKYDELRARYERCFDDYENEVIEHQKLKKKYLSLVYATERKGRELDE